jgi:hypothetical protein
MDKNQLQDLTKQYRRIPITSLQELGKVIFQNTLTCLIQESEDKILSVSIDELQMKWAEIKRHITLDDKAYIDDFSDGYFYFFDLWSSDSGELLLVLKKHH